MVGGYNNELQSSSAVFNNYRVPEPLLPPKRTVCINFNNAWYFEGCVDEYMLIYTIKASVYYEIVLMICFVLSLVERIVVVVHGGRLQQ
jgi:hypothetical protein